MKAKINHTTTTTLNKNTSHKVKFDDSGVGLFIDKTFPTVMIHFFKKFTETFKSLIKYFDFNP